MPEPVAADVPMASLRAIEGIYQLDNGLRLEVTARSGRLWTNEWVLVPTSDSTFFSPRDFGDVSVVRTAGSVSRLDWKVGGTTMAAPRVGDLEAKSE